MTPDRPTPPSRPGGKNESWRVERMVQRVPAHLGEQTTEAVSPWIMVAGIILLVLVVCSVLFFLLGGPARFFAAAPPTPTRTRALTPPITFIPVTLAAPTPSVTPTIIAVRYKVKSGDTLSDIAAKYKVSIQAIMTANSMKNETIRVGDELVIPLPTPTPPPGTRAPLVPAGTPTPLSLESPPSAASSDATPGVFTYIVQRGDTLITIAATFSTTVDAIRIANQLDSSFLSVGQALIVPVGAWTPTATVAPIAATTATPTAQFAYAAPNLKWPPDNFIFRSNKDIPTLEWLASATLKSNEFYVVHLTSIVNGQKKTLPSLSIRQGNSAKLDPAIYYPGANIEDARLSWYVVIVSQATPSARGPVSPAQLYASSPPSESRTFVWK
ncbi:MAG: LysM peptidoglycan-binding domain-containing protein [Chloroflexi bacterium]|nr:LysM peptidoglycan-binding domain-containing protein [Chloroflexota bacterium]